MLKTNDALLERTQAIAQDHVSLIDILRIDAGDETYWSLSSSYLSAKSKAALPCWSLKQSMGRSAMDVH